MIIKGNPGGNIGFWAKHLMRDDTNERAEVVEISGLLAEDLPTALREMQAVAAGSRSHGNFLYQANISPREDERLTLDQWRQAVDTLEKNLGLDGHQRIVVEHEKEGRVHRHVLWNRVDVDTMRVVDIGGNWRVHVATARELEGLFDLTPPPSPTLADRKPALELWEIRAAERSGIAPADVKAEVTELWRKAEDARAFAAALDERGYILAKGDRRDFCIVDQAGDAHSLARRLDGVRAKDVRAFMADIDRDLLPTVAEAKAEQRARHNTPELGRTTGEIRLLWNLSNSAEGFSQALDERGLSLARVDRTEAEASQRAQAFAEAVGNYAPAYKEGAIVVVDSFGHVRGLNEQTTGDTRAEMEKRFATFDPSTLLNVTDTRAALKEAARIEFIEAKQAERAPTKMEAKILELQAAAQTPTAFAASLYREGITLARVDATGIEGLAADQRAAWQDDRLFRNPSLKEGELVAVDNFGGVHRLNPQKLDLARIEEALTQGARTLPNLGDTRSFIAGERDADDKAHVARQAEFWNRVADQRSAREDNAQADWKARATAQVAARTDPHHERRVGLFVKTAAIDAPMRLVDFVANLLGGSGGPPPPATKAEADRMAEFKAQRRANRALENMRDSIERGERLNPSDVQNLTSTQLKNLYTRGDDFLRELIERMEERRQRDRDYGHERER